MNATMLFFSIQVERFCNADGRAKNLTTAYLAEHISVLAMARTFAVYEAALAAIERRRSHLCDGHLR